MIVNGTAGTAAEEAELKEIEGVEGLLPDEIQQPYDMGQVIYDGEISYLNITGSNEGGAGNSAYAASYDPNSILGPGGWGAQNFISGNETLPYQINFENASTATAPAQSVTLSDPLARLFHHIE